MADPDDAGSRGSRWSLAGGDVLVDGSLVHTDVHIDGDVVASLGDPPAGWSTDPVPPDRVPEATGRLVLPGFIDLQVNGAGGVDLVAAPERAGHVSRALVEHGVTAYLPTLVSAPAAVRSRALEQLRSAPPAPGAVPIGVHLEGPALSPDHSGAHRVNSLAPIELVVAEMDDWPECVRIVTVAPELDGALDLISELHRRGVVVAVGHTGASAERLHAAADAGCRYVTHLFNAMSPMHHREPGPAMAALVDRRLTVGVIADGVHLHDDALRLAWEVLGPERMNLVSDATAALGAGSATLGGRTLDISAGGAPHTGGGRLAGSAVGLISGVRRLRETTGCSIADAVSTVTVVPAGLLGDATRGRIGAGTRADLVICDPGLTDATVVVGGAVQSA